MWSGVEALLEQIQEVALWPWSCCEAYYRLHDVASRRASESRCVDGQYGVLDCIANVAVQTRLTCRITTTLQRPSTRDILDRMVSHHTRHRN